MLLRFFLQARNVDVIQNQKEIFFHFYQTVHLLMECPALDSPRRRLLKRVSSSVSSSSSSSSCSNGGGFLSLPRRRQFEFLLYGSDELAPAENVAVQEAVQHFSRAANELV